VIVLRNEIRRRWQARAAAFARSPYWQSSCRCLARHAQGIRFYISKREATQKGQLRVDEICEIARSRVRRSCYETYTPSPPTVPKPFVEALSHTPNASTKIPADQLKKADRSHRSAFIFSSSLPLAADVAMPWDSNQTELLQKAHTIVRYRHAIRRLARANQPAT
jgi:hypothetical protein